MPVARREARIELTLDAKSMAPGVDDARRRLRGVGDDAERAMSKANKTKKSGSSSLFSRAAGVAGGIAIASLSSSLVDGAERAVDFERNLTRLQIAADQTPGAMAGIRDAIHAISRETAVSSPEILAAGQTFFDLTGDMNGTKAALSSFARIAQASGSNMNDIATAAAAMQDALKVDPSQFEAVFSGLINQGKAGAVSLKDIAGEITGLAPRFARFKGSMGADGMIQLGAAFQVAKKGFGSASEAATGLEGLMTALSKNAKRFEAANVQVFDTAADGTKTFRNLHDIIVDISKSGLMKDPTKLSKAMGRTEAEQTAQQLMRLMGMYDQMAEAGNDTQVVARDSMTYLNSAAGKLDLSMNALKETFADAFTPARIEAFAAALQGIGSILGTIGGALGDLIAKWQQMRDLSGDPHERATSAAEAVKNASPQQIEAFAKEHDKAAAYSKASGDVGSFLSSGVLGSILEYTGGATGSTAAGIGRLYSTTHDTEAETAAKEHRSAAAKNAAVNRAAMQFTASRGEGDFDPSNPYGEDRGAAPGGNRGSSLGFTEGTQAGTSLAKTITAAVVEGMSKATITVKVGSEPVVKAAGNATRHRTGTAH